MNKKNTDWYSGPDELKKTNLNGLSLVMLFLRK